MGRGAGWGALACTVGCASAPGFPDVSAFVAPEAEVDSGEPPVDDTAGPERGAPVLSEADWTDAVPLDGGTFEMGCTRDPDWNCYVDEFPVRQVTIRPIIAMRYEVTAGLYADVLGLEDPQGVLRHVPATSVTWLDAVEFANALSERDGFEPAYVIGETADGTTVDADVDGWRLPTEAEWEFMARAGTDHTFAGGEAVLDVAWIDDNSPYLLQPSATKAPNAWGLFDLSGNAWEWTGDWLGPYPPEDEVDPEGFVEGTKKVVRGGSVDNHAAYARVSLRRLERPGGTLSCLGFRLVRTNGPSLRDDPVESDAP